jgi:hypothetical protein
MLRQIDRLLLRVESLPAAAKFWRETYGATISREDRQAVCIELPGGGEVILHSDPNLPEQAVYLLVDDVRQMHRDRATLRLEFRTAPAKGSRGYFATIRDPFGVMLQITDRTLDAAGEQSHAETFDAGGGSLFGDGVASHRPDRPRLTKLYADLGRTADDLPYTTHFETLHDAYASGFAPPRPEHAETWKHLLTARKAGELPKLGAAKSKPPEIDDEDRRRLRELLGDDIGKRDRLPYSPRFEELVAAFNDGRRRRFSPHQVWRLVAMLSK